MQTIEIKFNEKVIASAVLEEKEIQGKIRPCLKITMARAKKSFLNNYFLREGEREEKLAQVTKNLIAHEERKILDKENRKVHTKEFLSALKPGVILQDSWGYEQTNVEFYIVKKVQGSKVTIQELGHIESNNQSHGMACDVMPDIEKPYGEEVTYTVRGAGIRLDSSVCLTLWDGKKCYKSWYA